jgi:hypothetical protein
VSREKKCVLQEWNQVAPSYVVSLNMDDNVMRGGIHFIPQDLAFPLVLNAAVDVFFNFNVID